MSKPPSEEPPKRGRLPKGPEHGSAIVPYDSETQWVNGLGQNIDPPEDAERLAYCQQILKHVFCKYPEFGIDAEDHDAKDKLLALICAERWPELYRFPGPPKLTVGEQTNLEDWANVRKVIAEHYAKHQKLLSNSVAAPIAFERWPNGHDNATGLYQSANKGGRLAQSRPWLKIRGYSSRKLIPATTLEMNNALHSLDHLADRDECVYIVMPDEHMYEDLPPFGAAVWNRLFHCGANVRAQVKFPVEVLNLVERFIAYAGNDRDGEVEKFPGRYLLIAPNQSECAVAWESALRSIGAPAKLRVEAQLFRQMSAAKNHANSPSLFFVCMTNYVPPALLTYDNPKAPGPFLRDNSYRARRNAERERRIDEFKAAADERGGLVPQGAAILGGLLGHGPATR